MLEAEQEELSLGIAADRCLVLSGFVATVPLAFGRGSFLLRLGGGGTLAFGAQTVEIFGIKIHGAQL